MSCRAVRRGVVEESTSEGIATWLRRRSYHLFGALGYFRLSIYLCFIYSPCKKVANEILFR